MIIGPTDDRIEASALTDPNLSPFVSSTGAMWLSTLITDNGNGTSTINGTPYNTYAGRPICPGTKYYGQPVGSGLACTAFFIAPDLVATAQHCLTHWGWNWNNWKIILDYTKSASNNGPALVQNNRIYTPVALYAQTPNTDDDWAVLQVSPPLEDWRPTYPLSATGAPTTTEFSTISTSVAALGFGAGLPMKYSPNASAWTFGTDYFLADLDILDGNSGSPIFDTATSMTLGVLFGDYDEDYIYDSTAGCYRLGQYPDDHSPQNSISISYAKPIANLVAPAGNPIEPTWRTAKHLIEGPAALTLTSGDEYVFGIDYFSVNYKHRDTPTSWSAWTQIGYGGALTSQPVAVEGYNDIWLFGHYNGKLSYNYRSQNGTWSNWIPITTPVPLAQPVSVFSFDTPGANGLVTREIVVAMVGTDGVGRMFNITYQISGGAVILQYFPGTFTNGGYVVPWTSGAFALVAGTPGPLTGFGTTDDASGLVTIPTTVNGSKSLACARAVVNGPTYPSSPATISWSTCPQPYPTNVAVQSAQGVALPGGTQYLVARGLDDANLVSTRTGSTAAWSAFTPYGGHTFAKPVITKSLGSWWTYSLAADRRVAINQQFLAWNEIYDPPVPGAAANQCYVGGNWMHCCPTGYAMTGANPTTNVFKCAPLQNATGAITLDTGTQRYNMHACPSGQVMVGLRVDRNLLACQALPAGPITSERVDGSTNDAYPLHVCDANAPVAAMSGIRADQNLLLCATDPQLQH